MESDLSDCNMDFTKELIEDEDADVAEGEKKKGAKTEEEGEESEEGEK